MNALLCTILIASLVVNAWLKQVLVYPKSCNTKKSTKNIAARVLPSDESIALLEEKRLKKIEENEEKAQKKKERKCKKIAREENMTQGIAKNCG